MATSKNVICDNCRKEIPEGKVGAKLYLSPPYSGTNRTSAMAAYTHSGDLCNDCKERFSERLVPRKRRMNLNGKNATHTLKDKSK